MLEIEKTMLHILCEAKEGIPALITIKDTQSGEIKKGQIALNGDKINIAKSISSHIYDKFKRAANKTAKEHASKQSDNKQESKVELRKKAISKLSEAEQKAFQLFYGDKLKNG